ncbi:hypothetical protein E4U16_007224 [Claviceps sp. LM84 group G4]|nr:hypothetical protein E4U16_007224 [Claviceps sp. LM84 group G4]
MSRADQLEAVAAAAALGASEDQAGGIDKADEFVPAASHVDGDLMDAVSNASVEEGRTYSATDGRSLVIVTTG